MQVELCMILKRSLTTATGFSNSGGNATVSGSYNSLSITNITASTCIMKIIV